MKQTNKNWNYITRNYTELNGTQRVKITPIPTANGLIFKVVEVLILDNQVIYIGFYANRLGKAISKIKNSYFSFQDSADIYNKRGAIQYKMDLLSRIKEDLKRKQLFQEEEQKQTR